MEFIYDQSYNTYIIINYLYIYNNNNKMLGISLDKQKAYRSRS